MRDSHNPGRETEHKKHKRRKLRIVVLLVFLFLFLMACRRNKSNDPEPGVPLSLATQRAESIGALSYDLSFTVPASQNEPITGHEVIRFSSKDISGPLVLDFTPGADYLKSISIAGRPSQYKIVQDHILIPAKEIASEDNAIEITFRAGDAPLNRNPDFMYTLFVPARAHLA